MQPLGKPHFPPVFDLGGDLFLHSAEPHNAEEVFGVVDASREHLRAWLPWVDASREAKDTRAFLEQVAGQHLRGEAATFLIRERGTLAGIVGLHNFDTVNRSYQIGYWLAKDFEGRGLITRSCEHLVTVTFEFYEMERAVIRCALGNIRSAAVPKRLGFVLEGLERHGQKLNGRFIDLERYSRLSGE